MSPWIIESFRYEHGMLFVTVLNESDGDRFEVHVHAGRLADLVEQRHLTVQHLPSKIMAGGDWKARTAGGEQQ